MFGPYPAQEHGLLYFSNKLEDLKINEGYISFKISKRDFSSEPFTIKNYMNKYASSGFSRIALFFEGTFDKNHINLICKPDPFECYSEKMNFFEIK